MQALANVSVKRPVFATVLVLGIAVLGVAGYSQLGVDRFPKVDMPMVSVVTRLPGAAPEEVESELTDKIEESLNTISGIEELRSISSEGVSQIFMMFELEKNIDVAAQEVRDKVNLVLPELPRDLDAPVVSKLDPGATPVMYLAVRAEQAGAPMRQLTELGDKQIRRRLETVPGVGQVTLLGGRKRQVNVWIDPVKLRALGLTAADVQRAIGAQNLNLPAGSVKGGAEQRTLASTVASPIRRRWPTWSCASATATRSASPTWPASRMAKKKATRWPSAAARAPWCCRSASSPTPTRWPWSTH